MVKFLTALAAMAPGMRFEMTPEVLAFYELTLSKYPESSLLACVPELGLRAFFPRPHDFKEMIDPEGPTIEDRAQAAFAQFKAYVAGDKLALVDNLAAEASQGIFDLYSLKHASEKELIGYGFEFRAAYRVLAEKQKAQDNIELIEARASGIIGEAAKQLGMSNE